MSDEIALRLAFRVEGDWWNAYIAYSDTMKDARKVGSILMAAVRDNEERKQMFVELMRRFMSDILNETTGYRPTWWETKIAPEHERAENGEG